jgi:hypothetical protein
VINGAVSRMKESAHVKEIWSCGNGRRREEEEDKKKESRCIEGQGKSWGIQ